jgi:hypothetical protein
LWLLLLQCLVRLELCLRLRLPSLSLSLSSTLYPSSTSIGFPWDASGDNLRCAERCSVTRWFSMDSFMLGAAEGFHKTAAAARARQWVSASASAVGRLQQATA